jgi:hypothetical protein
MANITVSTNSNYDSSTNLGLLNGENITINSDAVLTVNSDVRWGQNAAVVGNITVTQGELKIDGSTVWWVPFSSSTGSVPALGTVGTPDVTRGGSNVGEFLGIFTALGVAPSSGAMPASGFIKLRSKTATFANGDVLTFAGGATATLSGAGQRGWIHFVGVEGTSSATGICNIPRLGKLTITGDWFELGTSNGTSGQTFQHYVSDFVPALQVETASGSGVYEWWGNAISADFSATIVTTDERGRYFNCTSAGVITFGGATFGKLPPNGAKIRVPNVHVSSSTSANWAANTFNTTAPANRYEFNSTGGPIDAQYVCCCGNFGASNATLYQVKNSCGADGCFCAAQGLAVATGISQVRFDNVAAARVHAGDYLQFGITYSTDIQYANCWSFQSAGAGTNTGAFLITNSTGITIDTCGVLSNKTVGSVTLSYNNTIAFKNCNFAMGNANNGIAFTGCTGVSMTNTKLTAKHIESGAAVTNAITLTNCIDVLIDTLSLWQGTSVASQFIIYGLSQTINIRVRNIGTRSSPIVLGAVCRYVVYLNNCSNGFVSQVYHNGGNQTIDASVGMLNCDEIRVSDCGDPTAYTGSSVIPGSVVHKTCFFKRTASGGNKVHSSSPTNGSTPTTFTTFGLHFVEEEVSTTQLLLSVFCGIEKSNSSFSTNAYVDDVGTILRDGSNGLLLRTLNDQVTWTWSYWIRGLTGFGNIAPIVSGTNTGNIALTYDLDKGTGFSGTFKTLNATNLSGETGISTKGVKIRLRARCATANSGNILRTVSIYGVTSASDITSNFYPYNEPPVQVTGGQSSSIVSVFRNSDGRLLDDVVGSSPIIVYPEWFSDTACTLRIRKPGWAPVESGFTLTEAGLSYPVTQTDIDNIADTDPGALGISVTNHGASPVTWNSKQWSITVTVTDGSSVSQIAQYLSWQTAQDSYSLGGGFHNTAWPPMVVAVGSNFETARGTLFGSAGASLKGVRVVDGSGNEILGFARMQADDGTYYSPAVSYSLTVSNIISNSRILVRRTDTLAVIANQTVTSGTFTYSYVYTTDIPIEIVVRKATASPYYQEWRTTTTLSNSNNTQTANQLSDT